MSYQFVEQLHKKAVPVERLCCVLGVSRPGYYRPRQRARATPSACLASTQLKAELADSGHALPISANVLARCFDPGRPNQAWVSDITYIRTRSGWLYLAVVLAAQ